MMTRWITAYLNHNITIEEPNNRTNFHNKTTSILNGDISATSQEWAAGVGG